MDNVSLHRGVYRRNDVRSNQFGSGTISQTGNQSNSRSPNQDNRYSDYSPRRHNAAVVGEGIFQGDHHVWCGYQHEMPCRLTSPIKFKIGDKQFNQQLYVAPVSCDMILGCDFIMHNRVVMNIRELTITVQNRTCH
ncbi:Hypothetical predicted protein [Mytilus galloprovincialis]|uniref:Uncharacterized protein n=1 Tax=Mytilus galloprovincialis TaxID=29158 RepID=A0A8B6DL72_MYTGA|nr:Hypothetical predicted protein [Mytilus galloprovincialis]